MKCIFCNDHEAVDFLGKPKYISHSDLDLYTTEKVSEKIKLPTCERCSIVVTQKDGNKKIREYLLSKNGGLKMAKKKKTMKK